MLLKILSIKKKMPVFGSQWVIKQSYNTTYCSERLLQPHLSLPDSINLVKVLFSGFEKCFGWFTMLLVEGSSKTGLFRH